MKRMIGLNKASMQQTPQDRVAWCRTLIAASFSLALMSTTDLVSAETPELEAERAAAAEGDASALLRLATRYETGDDVAFDLDRAAMLLEQAARRGDATAQYRLGLMQAGGLGEENDLALAYGWLRLAEKAAPESTEGLLGEAMGAAILERLDQAEREAAEAWIDAFVPAAEPVDLPALLGEMTPEVELANLVEELRGLGCGPHSGPGDAEGDRTILAYARPGSADAEVGLAEIRKGLASQGVAFDVQELNSTICALRSLLVSLPDRLIETGVALAEIETGVEASFKEGDRLQVDVPAANADRYIAVDYLVHSGKVLHLHPAGGDDGKLPAGETLRLGDGSQGRQPWTIGPPFGRDLLVVTFSEKAPPLDRARRPMVEPAETYLTDWRRRIDNADADPTFRVFERVILTRGR